MSTRHDGNKEVVRALFAAVERVDLNATLEIYADDAVDHRLPPGREALIEHIGRALTMFSDLKIDVHHMVEEGDLVAVRSTLSGIHNQSGKSVEYQVVSFERLREGRIVERWELADTTAMLRQLDLE